MQTMDTSPDTQPHQPHKFWKTIFEWVKVIALALIISLPIRFFVAEPFVVNGASMDPTFSTNQFLIVDRLTYRLENPSRGDVIVFEYPNDPSTYYIKRIIGLPGETIDIKDGAVTISSSTDALGHILPPFTLNEPYIEAIHASHDTYHVDLGPTQFFVMGDNRAQSSDSRAWGPLDRHFMIGRPVVRLLPLSTLSILPGQYHAYTQPK